MTEVLAGKVAVVTGANSGIGLAMAYRVVQLHHGSLEFTSVAGHGTTFYLRFPLAETTKGEPARVQSEDSVSKA